MISAAELSIYARGVDVSNGGECELRCKISRLYYAAYHFCNTAAAVLCGDLAPGEGENLGSHERLFLRMQGHSKFSAADRSLRVMAEQTKKLKALRVLADYEIGKVVAAGDCERGQHHLYVVEREHGTATAAAPPPAPAP